MNLQVSTTSGLGLVIDDYSDGGAIPLLLVRNTSNLTTKFSVLANGTCNAVVFNPPSDRNAKENFAPVSPSSVLDKVVSLPISQWNFKTDAGVTHIGPMAQDFYAAFGLGTDDKHIATVDADGVALAAIQGLNQKLNEKDIEIQKLEARLERLEQLINKKNRGEQ
jgi:hypothetical protein